ncbi:MAG: hypothetical protein AB9903_28015 [Vulcanimicrobiota bacterium]
MIARDTGLGAPDEKSAADLATNLGKVDPDILKLVQQNGTKFVIIKNGQSLLDTGAIRQQDISKISSNGESMSRDTQPILHKLDNEFGQEKAELLKNLEASRERDALKPREFAELDSIAASWAAISRPPASEETQKLEGALNDNNNKQFNLASEQIEKVSGGKAKIFSPAENMTASSGGNMSSMGSLAAHFVFMTSSHPLSTIDMAQSQGAKTPEEIKQFTDSTDMLNGDRLTKLRQETLSKYEANIATMQDPEQKRQAEAELDNMKKNPKSIPVDYINNPVAVPNTYFYRPGEKPGADSVVVDIHDYMALNKWHNGEGKVMSHTEALDSKKTRITNGQNFHMDGINTIVLRDSNLTDSSPVHELGHVAEDIIKKKDPDFSQQLTAERDNIFTHIGEGDGRHEPITPYAGTESKENLAEGFSMYFNDRKLLNMKDKELYELIRKEIEYLKTPQ